MKNVFVSIINFNGTANTLECLSSLQKVELKKTRLSVLVVDNGSKEKFPSSQMLRRTSKIKDLRVIRNEENLGFSGGHNVGIKHALSEGVDYILILNNDTIVDRTLIEELLDTAEMNKKIGIVAPKIYFAKEFEFHKDRYKKEDLGKVIWYAGGITDWNNVINHHKGVDEVDNGQYDELQRTDFASGACMLIKREVFEKVGLFDEKYFLYYEDSDFCERVKRAGYTILFSPKAILWHKNAGSAGGSGSKLQDYYISRNRLLFGMRYAPFRSKLALIKESVSIFVSGRRQWQKRGILDFYSMSFGRGSYPI